VQEQDTPIAEAEWQVMRTVWADYPVSSADIIRKLRAATTWEPTTIKTLLARLVRKSVLGYEVRGKSFLYSPLISEEACIRREMRRYIEKVYGGQLWLETNWFRFKGAHDPDYQTCIADELERRYPDISAKLSVVLSEKQLVYLHASRRNLHSALGVLDGPVWLRSGFAWGILHLAPRDCFDDIQAEKAAVHTLVQILVSQINPSAPYWLSQAVAAYESGWLTRERILAALAAHPEGSGLSGSHDRIEAFLSFREAGGYELGYTVAEFLATRFGYQQLGSFLRDPTGYQAVFGMSEAEFWSQWRSFLDTHYRR